MFERYNQTEGTRKAIAVELILKDGEMMKGQLMSYYSASLVDLLNSDREFLEFETYDGNYLVLGKSSVQQIKPVDVPAAQELVHSQRQLDKFDPFAILGITRAADAETLRAAYRDMVKLYHPDRYAGLELPREILNYMASVSKRINAAFTAVSSHIAEREHASANPPKPEKTEPERPVFKMTSKRRSASRAANR